MNTILYILGAIIITLLLIYLFPIIILIALIVAILWFFISLTQ